MKKILLFMAFVFCFTNAFGKKKIEVAYGNITVLKEVATAKFVLDLDETTWEGKENYKQRLGDKFPERFKLSNDAFVRYFNATTKGLKITDDEDAKYTIIFKVVDLEQYMGAYGRFAKYILGTIDIVDNSTKNVVCSVNVKRLEGSADYTVPGRIEKAYSTVAIKLNELNKK
ncbi:MAG: hypothetical protein IKW77_03310 [Salinivirgaceae bacterium]|nr:hypothetical protein [Salinivirgaceae bacterium]MBR5643194.1 hypothetical protein [Salinivirgaceae bacterium]